MNKNKDNRGFSLVELIIVIAIMAILVGVLAPQFLKYVERSRKSTDCQNVAAIITACQVYAADPNVDPTKKLGAGTIKITTTSTAVSGTNASGNANEALAAAGITNLQLKSSQWPGSSGNISEYDITVSVAADGTVTFTGTALNPATDYDIIKGLYK